MVDLAPLLALIATAAAHVVLMFREGGWHRIPLTPGRLLFCAFTLSVYAAAVWRARHSRGWGDAAAAWLVCLLAFVVLGDALFLSKGDQRGLVFVFLPPLQWLAWAAVAGLWPLLGRKPTS